MKKVILCVDDEKIILSSLKLQLKKNFGSEFNYEFAENALEAMDLLDELIYDGTRVILIVSDWLMPSMKGDEFLVNVHKKYPKIVKIMLTGQADKIAVSNAETNANLYTCIRKPWLEEVLIDTIKLGLKPKKINT
ncbi:MAG: response regulator [Cytophagales bacterium]|nr:response regulator [Cytophagales bacterium]